MTLALFLLFASFVPPLPLSGGAVYLSAQSAGSQASQTPIPQTAPPAKPETTAATPTKTSPATAASKRSRPKKKSDGCKSTVASATGASSASVSKGSAEQASDSSIAEQKCPPPKIVIRQGGTSEPSIQLAGGSQANQSSQAKGNVTQMLDSTEGNLKKLSEQQLNSTEQETVAQIRQFMDQSKAAVAAGDTERARTLAWKAQTLSEDLTNPKK